MSKRPHIPEADRIPLGQKVAFAIGSNADYVATSQLASHLWMPFFNIGLGMNPVVLGGILMVLRAWDAVIDPLMGNISDNARTRWGRRRPFIFVGAIATALAYPLFWYLPVSLGDTGRTIYLTVVGMIFFSAFTVWSMPYYGLQLELTPNYDERTRLAAWMTLCGKISLFIGGWLLAFVMFIGAVTLGDLTVLEGKGEWLQRLAHGLQPWLANLAGLSGGEKPIVAGMRVTGWLIALLVLVMALAPALFVKERYYTREVTKQPREPLLQSIRKSFRCAPLWVLISLSFFLVLGTTSVASLGNYVNFYYVCQGDLVLGSTLIGLKSTVVMVAGITLIPVYTWLGERLDKRVVVMLMLGVAMVGHLSNWFLMTPENPYLQIIPGIFEASAIAAVWLFVPSMKADVADYDEERSSQRREGALNAFYSWFIKASLTASMGIGGVVLHVSGFNPALDVQTVATTHRMFMIFLALPMVLWGIALCSAWFYPLTRARCVGIRATLEGRRGRL